MLKVLIDISILAVIAYIVYIKFFKKENSPKQDIQDGLMIECSKCGVFVEQKNALCADSKCYCSVECKNKAI